MTKTVRCYRCGMTFDKRLPHKLNGEKRPEWTTCAEPGCERFFWHLVDNGIAQVGVAPEPVE